MISNPKNLSEQLCNLSERLGIEMRMLNRTKVSTVNGLIPDNSGAITVDVGVKTVNGTQPDPDGNVTIQTGGDTSNLVPKTGNRGLLAGFNSVEGAALETNGEPMTVVIDKDTPDDLVIDSGLSEGGNVELTLHIASNSPEELCFYIKNIFLSCDPSKTTVELGDNVYVDDFFTNGYVNNVNIGALTQIIVVCYGAMVFVSSKLLHP